MSVPYRRRSLASRLLFAARRHLRWIVPIVGLVVLSAGGAAAALETETVSSYPHGVWWALSLVIGAGSGGTPPATAAGRALASFLVVFGTTVIAVFTAAVVAMLVREDEQSVERREEAFERRALERLDAIAARVEALEPLVVAGRGDDPAETGAATHRGGPDHDGPAATSS